MARAMFFSAAEKASIPKTFSQAQRLISSHFKLSPYDWKMHPYDVRTLEQLENHEVREGVFAYLCKYPSGAPENRARGGAPHFFRVCLQDGRILEAMGRGGSFIKFVPLMLYIATHELIHILRFSRGECDFETPPEKRRTEEERVDDFTRCILKPMKNPGLRLVIDCFGDEYRIGDLIN